MSNVGKVVQVTGPVVDIAFDQGHLPEILNAIRIETQEEGGAGHLICEVAQHLGENRVRTIAMSGTDGLYRGMAAVDTEGQITVPVGEGVLGRILNVTGDPVDEAGPVKSQTRRPIHAHPRRRIPSPYRDVAAARRDHLRADVPACRLPLLG